MKKLLVIVDMQNDFIDGPLGTPQAQAIVPAIQKKIETWDGDVVCTRDTHDTDYQMTHEGQWLPIPHCIDGTDGHEINREIWATIMRHVPLKNLGIVNKHTFGCLTLANAAKEFGYDFIELCGVCTDICVVTNALMLRTYCPESDIVVDAACCAGVTPESHEAALSVMDSCHITVKNWHEEDVDEES